jgi:hypothetical protein
MRYRVKFTDYERNPEEIIDCKHLNERVETHFIFYSKANGQIMRAIDVRDVADVKLLEEEVQD